MSILVVGYNSASMIGACIGSIAQSCKNRRYEVLLVDQGDGTTEELVRREFPHVEIVESRGNLGFAGGNNLLAAAAKGKYLLLLNPDVELEEGAVDALLEGAARYPRGSAWGGVTLDQSRNPDIGNTVHVPSLREMLSRIFGRSSARLSPNKAFDQDERAFVLSGGFVLISRQAWDEADGLDQRYFLYCEEVDFFYRLALGGHEFWRIADARAVHKIGHGEVMSPMRTLYQAAGIMQFARLHWSGPGQLAAFALMWIGAFQRYAIGSVLSSFGQRFRAMAAGHRGLVLMPGLWRHGYDPKRGLLAKIGQR